jgi:hypothetical protein
MAFVTGSTAHRSDARFEKMFSRLPADITEVYIPTRILNEVSIRYKQNGKDKWLFPYFKRKNDGSVDRSGLILEVNEKHSLHYSMSGGDYVTNLHRLLVCYMDYIAAERECDLFENECYTLDYKGPERDRYFSYFERMKNIVSIHITRTAINRARVRLYSTKGDLNWYRLVFDGHRVWQESRRDETQFMFEMQREGITNLDLIQVCSNLLLCERWLAMDHDERKKQGQI